MNPQHHRIFLCRVEIDWLDQPTLHFQTIFRCDPKFFGVAESDVGQYVLIHVDELLHICRVFEVEGDQRAGLFEACPHNGNLPVVGHRVTAQNFCASCYRPRLSINRDEIDVRRTLFFHLVVNTRPISGPPHIARRTRKLAGPQFFISAGIVHQVETGHVIGKLLFVITDISDPSAIGRDLRARVRTAAVGQRFDRESLQIDRINLAVTTQVLGIRLSN